MPKQKQYTKRADGRYHTSIPTGKFKEDGKEIRIDVYAHTISDLEDKIDEIKAQIANNSYVSDKKTTFAKYKQIWFETYINNTALSRNRKAAYRNTIKNHTGVLDPLPVSQIVKSDVQKGYNELQGHPDLQREYKMTVGQIFRSAIEDGIAVRNPADNITVDKVRKQKKRALTSLERKAIQNADLSPKEKCFVYMLWYAGLRRQEILALTKKDIGAEEIHINKAIEFDGNSARLKETKSEASERDVPVLSPLAAVLWPYFNSVDTLYLFPDSKGSIMSKTQFRRFWSGIKEKINAAAGGRCENRRVTKVVNGKNTYHYYKEFTIDMTEGLTPHTFRHEFATILYYSGVDLLDAIRIFGHSDSKTMTDIYAELRRSESKSTDKLNKYLEGYISSSEK